MASFSESVLSEARAFAGFLAGLPRFLRQPMTLEDARRKVHERLENRETNFLASIERTVFRRPASPYRSMLELAGCELGDLKRMVEKDGLEATLRTLRDGGVYVTFEEFKGRSPIIRSGREIPAGPGAFDNPALTRYFPVTTGGSSGAGRRVSMDLTHMRDRMVHRVLIRHVQGVSGVPAANWSDIPPAGGLTGMLMSVASGEPAPRWFSASRPGQGSAKRFILATHAALAVARLAGKRVHWPEYLAFDDAIRLAQWARDRIGESGRCTMHGSVSRMLRVAVAASDAGIDLTGAVIRGGGEPPTTAKVAQITRTGAVFHSSYSYTEVGSVGTSCLSSPHPNDQHFFRDHLAMIQAPRAVPGFDLEVAAFCFTTLLPTAPKLLLNVESDDYGVVESRRCGCPWEALGFPDHLLEIRSFRKLTGEGVTLVGSDMERILEETLPQRFGGSPLDYQLLEEEDDRGFTRLVLLVAPSVSLPDEQAPIQVVLEALGRLGPRAGSSHQVWGQAGTFRVRRESPRLTSRGKLMPLQLARQMRPASRQPAHGDR